MDVETRRNTLKLSQLQRVQQVQQVEACFALVFVGWSLFEQLMAHGVGGLGTWVQQVPTRGRWKDQTCFSNVFFRCCDLKTTVIQVIQAIQSGPGLWIHFAFVSMLCDSIVDVYRSADPKPLKNAAFDFRVSVLVRNLPCLTLSTLSRSCLERGWKMTIVTKKDISWWANSSEDLVGSPKFATCLDLFRFPWKYWNLAARCATVRSTGQLFWSTSWSPFYLSTFVAVGTETQGHHKYDPSDLRNPKRPKERSASQSQKMAMLGPNLEGSMACYVRLSFEPGRLND